MNQPKEKDESETSGLADILEIAAAMDSDEVDGDTGITRTPFEGDDDDDDVVSAGYGSVAAASLVASTASHGGAAGSSSTLPIVEPPPPPPSRPKVKAVKKAEKKAKDRKSGPLPAVAKEPTGKRKQAPVASPAASSSGSTSAALSASMSAASLTSAPAQQDSQRKPMILLILGGLLVGALVLGWAMWLKDGRDDPGQNAGAKVAAAAPPPAPAPPKIEEPPTPPPIIEPPLPVEEEVPAEVEEEEVVEVVDETVSTGVKTGVKRRKKKVEAEPEVKEPPKEEPPKEEPKTATPNPLAGLDPKGEIDPEFAAKCVENPNLPGCATMRGASKESGADLDKTLPEKLSQSALSKGFRKVKGQAKACGTKHAATPGTKVRVKLSIAGDTGKVMSSDPMAPHNGGDPLGKCVAAALEKASFSRFKAGQMGTTYPITF